MYNRAYWPGYSYVCDLETVTSWRGFLFFIFLHPCQLSWQKLRKDKTGTTYTETGLLEHSKVKNSMKKSILGSFFINCTVGSMVSCRINEC